MAIRIDYSPIRDLVGLAQAAGAGVARQRQAAGDIAFTQMMLTQQTRNVELAARLQASDRAFALQRAALSRAARTPTRAPTMPGPIVTEMVRAQREEQQLEQLELIPGLSEGEKARMQLNIAAGRTVAEALPRPKPVTMAQQIGLWKDRWNRELKPVDAQIKSIRKEMLTPYNVFDDEGEIVPELQKQETHRLQALGKQLREREATRADILRRMDQEGGTIRAGIQPQATGAAREPAAAPTAPMPLPARREEAIAGQVYTMPDGSLARWDGTNFQGIR